MWICRHGPDILWRAGGLVDGAVLAFAGAAAAEQVFGTFPLGRLPHAAFVLTLWYGTLSAS